MSRHHDVTYTTKRTAESISLGTGAVPADLARPRDRGRATLIANIAVGGGLLVLTLAMLAYAVLGVQW
jgi:hypothetical protein